MSDDGENFNSRIEDELATRLYRLIEQIKPMHVQEADVAPAMTELFRYRAPDTREPWEIAVAVIAAVYARLNEIAARYRKTGVEDRGHWPEIFQMQQKLDEEENRWRQLLRLPVVASGRGEA